MLRDMDFARHILTEMEAYPHFDQSYKTISLDSHTQEELSYHVRLLAQAGLIEAEDVSSMDGTAWNPVQLTNEGHEFLEAARNDTFWKKAKATALSGAGSLTLEGLKLALKMLVQQSIASAMPSVSN
jgi:hypothetical protein